MNLGPPLKEQEIEAFEKEIGYALPQGYRKFLLVTNGGDPEDAGSFFVREALRQSNVWTGVRFFYGLRRTDVECWTLKGTLELCEELLAEGLLPIATDDLVIRFVFVSKVKLAQFISGFMIGMWGMSDWRDRLKSFLRA